MLRVNMNENVTVHKIPERQATVQGKLSAGRVVEQNPVTARIPGQMAGASSTSRRTTTHHAGAVKRTADFPTEAASAKRPKGPETTTSQQAKDTFRKQFDEAFEKLQKERESVPDDLSFCLAIIDTHKVSDWNLHSMKADMTPRDYDTCLRYSLSKMRVLYSEHLRKALVFFQNQIANGQSWIYTCKLDKVTRGFNKLGYRSATNDMTILKKIWTLHINEELDYLQYLKGSPGSSYPAWHAVDNIDWLTSASSPSRTLGLISNEYREKITQQANSLYQEIIHSDMDHSYAGQQKENVFHRDTDIMMEKRKHHDLIHEQLDRLHNDYDTSQGSGSTLTHRFRYLKELFELYKKYNNLVGNPHARLFWRLNRMIIQLVDEAQNKLQRGAYDNTPKLKEEVSALVDDLKKEEWLNREQNDLSFNFMQLQSTVLPVARENKMMYGQIHQELNDISTMIYRSESRDIDDNLIALNQFKQLVDKYEDKLDKFPEDKARGIRSRLRAIKTIFFAKLFAPIINDYNKRCQRAVRDIERSCTIMRRHKDSFIALNQYLSCVLIPNSDNVKSVWQWAACFAWLDDLKRLCHQTSFNANDVDNLLALKDITPTPPLHQVTNCLRATLINLFRFMLRANPDTTLIGKVTKLSEWTNDLFDRHHHSYNHTLHECNKKWREKYVSKAGGSATTSSDASAARMPSSVHPGTLSVLSSESETFDCHSRMRLQDVPHAGQFSTPCPAVPTPAPCGAFQQSGSSIPCRAPVAQSATASRAGPH